MTHDQQDAELGKALRDVASEPSRQFVDWVELRSSIGARASSELARRRLQHRRRRLGIIAVPAALAASVALFVLASRTPDPATVDPSGREPIVAAGSTSIEELLDANVSDGQFRAVLFGAAEADDLLLLAAQDERP